MIVTTFYISTAQSWRIFKFVIEKESQEADLLGMVKPILQMDKVE
jgi:hypothetical protein